MTLAEFLTLFSTVALIVFVVLVVLALGRMLKRLLAFWDAELAAPVLLRRDLVLFGTFAIYFGLVIVFRLQGFVLTQNPFWIIPSTIAVLSAMAYWVWVEYNMDK